MRGTRHGRLQHPVDHGHQLPVVEDGLDDDGLEPGVEEALAFDLAREPRQRHGGNIAVSGPGSDHLEAPRAVDRMHADIQHQHIRLRGVDRGQRFHRGRVTEDHVLLAEEYRDSLEVVLVVLDEDQARAGHDLVHVFHLG